jgi:hypothetical protein
MRIKTIIFYVSTWITTIRLVRRYGLKGAENEVRKEMQQIRMRYFRITGRKMVTPGN